MKMIRAMVRPEKADEVLHELAEKGFVSATRYSVLGRGKQRGLKLGDVYYDEIPKETIVLVVEDQDREKVIDTIQRVCRSGDEGSFGDGKIFVLPVEKAVTISSGAEAL
ncbi:nitrogen fixation nifHD region glnB 1 [Enterococcus florum]|uniref:Nitrogen fixation nifHD region glnB 1 n=1 Tax=Enterococcus florum TaxID=2480627 RepID=A0A4P5P4E1_9ENTE|nr:P-II family nitrogen regulator [Enterococcus florum]GCF92675.1 nitrogen fixation nifHD region glnB 1 [Enterococcus florum]